MPKAKSRKIVMKRFKITGKGKLRKKHCNISHLNRRDDSSTKSRKKHTSTVSKGFAKKIKLMIIS